jgi:1-acyl-sn-glycerol-3-phosphate acyltransferase/ketosteroid isomerase-like protein
MMSELWTRRRIVVRGLGDHAHYAIPVWRDLLTMGGMVRGTREHMRALMRDGQNILVFPGGGDEVFKARGQEYRRMWKERLGFARLASEFGYPIVPFAAVGAEEMLHVVADSRTPVAAQVSALMRRLVGLPLPPLVRGIGPTLLPRPERLYFWFGEPVDTSGYGDVGDDDAAARTVRDEVKAAVEEGIQTLLSEREHDPHRGLLPRLWHEEQDLPQLATSDPDAWLVTRAFEAWNEHGAAGAAAWVSRRAQLTDPPEQPGARTWRGRERALARLEVVASELGVSSAEVTDAHTIGDHVLAVFRLRWRSGSPTDPSGFAALLDVDQDQIVRMRVFRDREAALRANEP